MADHSTTPPCDLCSNGSALEPHRSCVKCGRFAAAPTRSDIAERATALANEAEEWAQKYGGAPQSKGMALVRVVRELLAERDSLRAALAEAKDVIGRLERRVVEPHPSEVVSSFTPLGSFNAYQDAIERAGRAEAALREARGHVEALLAKHDFEHGRGLPMPSADERVNAARAWLAVDPERGEKG